MSFIGAVTQGVVYAPGYFLAHQECERKTRQFNQTGATTTADGKKYWKMGSVYPSNDANAEGIVYEDVDVSNGAMPGSVVLNGVVYEDRLPVTSDTYDAVTPQTGDNPAEEGWYEKVGNEYVLTKDTTATEGKTYYAHNVVRIAPAAKTALQAKGFTFKTSPAVTRD